MNINQGWEAEECVTAATLGKRKITKTLFTLCMFVRSEELLSLNIAVTKTSNSCSIVCHAFCQCCSNEGIAYLWEGGCPAPAGRCASKTLSLTKEQRSPPCRAIVSLCWLAGPWAQRGDEEPGPRLGPGLGLPENKAPPLACNQSPGK